MRMRAHGAYERRMWVRERQRSGERAFVRNIGVRERERVRGGDLKCIGVWKSGGWMDVFVVRRGVCADHTGSDPSTRRSVCFRTDT